MNSSAPRILQALAWSLLATQSAATTISIHNINAPGVGFNDPTVVAPVGGNNGTTRGQQRLNVFQQAATQWAALLKSNVAIVVEAQMIPDFCTTNSATLGQAGPLASAHDFPGAPRANTSYPIAEANALFGADIDAADDDIQAQFNSTLDNGSAGCLNGTKWWYGIDPSIPPAANTISLLPVVFHELGHGLGFTSLTDDAGVFVTSRTPIWANYLYDTDAGMYWKDMSSVQRVTSAINDPSLVWTGPRTNKEANAWLKAGNSLIINSPAPLAGAQEVGTAQFGPAVPAAGVSGNLVLVNDGVNGAGSPAGTTTDGCETPFVNAASVSGKIAVMDRGFCGNASKVKNAQNAGAIATIIVNNEVDGLRLPLTLTGSDGTITIPSYSVTLALGSTIKTNLPSPGVSAKLGYANITLNQGCVRMFAPDPLLQGSSVSHFHADASPNLLMEPALNTSIFNKVDLTLPLFADTDWQTNKEEILYLDGFDKNPCQFVPN